MEYGLADPASDTAPKYPRAASNAADRGLSFLRQTHKAASLTRGNLHRTTRQFSVTTPGITALVVSVLHTLKLMVFVAGYE